MALSNDKRKQSLYIPDDLLAEIEGEAQRQDRSLSWLVQRAWSLARDRIRQMPGVNDIGPQAPQRPPGA